MKIYPSITDLRYNVISLSKAKNVVRFQGFRYEAVRNKLVIIRVLLIFFFTEFLEPLSINDGLWE